MNTGCKKCGTGRIKPVSNTNPSEAPVVASQTTNTYSKGSGSFKQVPKEDAPYEITTIKPKNAPDISYVKTEEFKNSLVHVEAAAVIKSKCEVKEVVEEEPNQCGKTCGENDCVNPCACEVQGTKGYNLGHQFKDACEVKEMTLLGRVGCFLTKLGGEGVLYIKDGVASVRDKIPLSVTHLYHKWFQPSPNSDPVIGPPMPVPYLVVADEFGCGYPIMGLPNEDSITVWDHETAHFEQKSVTEFPICVREQLPSTDGIELVGFSPLAVSEQADTLRCLKKLQGSGIICFEQVVTAPQEVCDCEECQSLNEITTTTTVARFIPEPDFGCDETCPAILAAMPNGEKKWVRASEIECLRGQDGVDGQDGQDGKDGEDCECEDEPYTEMNE